MNKIEVLLSRISRIGRELQEITMILKTMKTDNYASQNTRATHNNCPTTGAGLSRKVRSDRKYLSDNERKRAYRKRKKEGLTIQDKPPS